jgi:hypothetical protein
MSEAPPLPDPAPAQPGAAAPAAPAKRPGPIRTSAVIVLLVAMAVMLALVPLVLEPWIVGQITAALARQGLELAPGSKLSVSVFGVEVAGTDLKLREIGDPTDVFTATKLTASVGLLASVGSGDVVIDDLVVEGLSGSLRRRNGHVPILTPKDDPSSAGTDWLKLGQRLLDWVKQRQQQAKGGDHPAEPGQKPEDKAPPAKRPPPELPADWPTAKRYEPTPGAGGHWPRLLIRHLSISGGKLGLPDETPFDVTSFAVAGSNVAIDLHHDEAMALTATVDTRGAGPMAIDLKRQGGETGTMHLTAKQLPVEALGDRAVGGDAVARYGATGLADLDLTTAWTGWALTGAIDSVVSKLSMAPAKDAGDQARQVAEVVNALKGQPLKWPMKLGGTLYAPTITDSGVETVLKGSAVDAAKGVVKDKATEEAGKLIEKEGAKNPEVKKATDAAKDLFKGLGK